MMSIRHFAPGGSGGGIASRHCARPAAATFARNCCRRSSPGRFFPATISLGRRGWRRGAPRRRARPISAVESAAAATATRPRPRSLGDLLADVWKSGDTFCSTTRPTSASISDEQHGAVHRVQRSQSLARYSIATRSPLSSPRGRTQSARDRRAVFRRGDTRDADGRAVLQRHTARRDGSTACVATRRTAHQPARSTPAIALAHLTPAICGEPVCRPAANAFSAPTRTAASAASIGTRRQVAKGRALAVWPWAPQRPAAAIAGVPTKATRTASPSRRPRTTATSRGSGAGRCPRARDLRRGRQLRHAGRHEERAATVRVRRRIRVRRRVGLSPTVERHAVGH